MIVWQDMVNGGAQSYPHFGPASYPRSFPASHVMSMTRRSSLASVPKTHLRANSGLSRRTPSIENLRNFACIANWTVFNEAWGQFEANKMTDALAQLDDTRPFDQASGWYDQGGGDYVSEHNYFRDLHLPKGHGCDDERARVISEFGGSAFRVEGHSAIERSYGYDTHEDAEEFAAAVRHELEKANALEAEGLSGYVYTQLTDVEEEVNGLITYDRRVVKARPTSVDEA